MIGFIRLPIGQLFFLGITLLSLPTRAFESDSAIKFYSQKYTYAQSIREIPRCPGLIDTLYSMKTMRKLTSFVDKVTMLRQEPGFQLVRVEFSMLGLHGALLYERTIDKEHGLVVIALKSFENNFGFLPYPASFVAKYRVTHEDKHTSVTYTQNALISKDISVFYRIFVRSQMRSFDRKLQKIIKNICPAPKEATP